MHSKRNIQTLMMGFVFLLVMTGPGLAGGPPHEPSEVFLVNEDVNVITGLYIREYSLSGDGTVDYKTARQIILSYYNEYWNSVVETKEFPLFYWHDANHDGDFEMWVDRQVEGCPCDIHRYEPMEEPETVLSHLPTLPPGGSP